MTVSTSPARIGIAAPRPSFRFGRESGSSGAAGQRSVQWLLKRNCSLAPRQLLATFAMLAAVTLVIASFFWVQGALLVLPFATVELIAVGGAMLFYARHAGDYEAIDLRPGRLTVAHAHGTHTERAEFEPAWVRIEPQHGERSLIELSGQGQRIAVGRFVRPELRRQLADELRQALRNRPAATPSLQNPSDNTTWQT